MKKKKLVVGILAHVDAGKTTLAESFLYLSGRIRSLGRVDHGDAFLDNYSLERERGITIFSKQAHINLEQVDITLLDTPGHVDFSAEMERTLKVLDYAILVISGADGVQGHVETLWRLLKRYEVPVFLFVNKMDQEGTDQNTLLSELQTRLDERCICFQNIHITSQHREDGTDPAVRERFMENLALCDESLMEEYLETGEVSVQSVGEAIADRKVFPCYFGSALKLTGVEDFLKGIETYTLPMEYPEQFGARVFKIARDITGKRLTYLKVTGGSLKVKDFVSNAKSSENEEQVWEEKADQLRIYDGAKFTPVDEVAAGEVCTVTGLTKTFAGQGLGYEWENTTAVLEPVLNYRIELPEGCDPVVVLGQLRQLEEEDPQLHLVWKEESGEIHVQVMGEVQIEILKSLILERFGLEVTFGTGSIVYKETIAEPVVGIGHFEPLRHYAEVHLLLEPGEPGSGLQFASLCSEDILDRNWQRLILTHLEERIHPGVLTGSEITDMRIILLAGRAHQKHTEGGDFRQATYRAVRQGLRRGKCILLEPVFAFTLELPTALLGRAMTDVKKMCGHFDTPATEGDRSVLTGTAPVATMRDYQRQVNAYTGGLGRFSCYVKGYEPCHNTEEVIAGIGYDPEGDLANPTGSVFCAHGAGFVVPWDQVEDYAHVENGWHPEEKDRADDLQGYAYEEQQALAAEDLGKLSRTARKPSGRNKSGIIQSAAGYITQEEIDAIFAQTYGKKAEDNNRFRRYHRGSSASAREPGNHSYSQDATMLTGRTGQTRQEEYLLVDGYNIIFAWEELRELAGVNLDSARDRLMDIMSNYQGYLGHTLILVFDAYKVKGNPGSVMKYHNIYVVYTKEAETADQYIEKTVHAMGQKHRITVATSDALEQMIIWGNGAMRLSAPGLKQAVEAANADLRERYDM